MSKKIKEDKKKKEDKPKLKPGRVLANNLWMLRAIRTACPGYIITDVLVDLSWAVLEFFCGSFLLKIVVDNLERGEDVSRLYVFVIVIMVIHLGVGLLQSWFWNLYTGVREIRLTLHLRKKMYAKMQSVELSCYEDPAYYEKYLKAMAEIENRAFNVLWSLETLLSRFFSLTANALLLCTIDPMLVLFALIPIAVGFLRTLRNKVSVSESNEMKRVDWRAGYIQRCFCQNEYAKEMRLTDMPDKLMEDYAVTLADYERIKKKHGFKLAGFDYGGKIAHEVLTVLGAMLYAVYCTMVRGTMSAGDCIVVLNSVGSVSGYLEGLVTNVTSFHEHALFIENLRAFLDYEPKVPANPTGRTAGAGVIEVNDLHYRYVGAETDALDGVTMTIRPGEKIALVGANGSGKSTFVKLLTHMYQPSGGSITLNGVPMDDHALVSWRDAFVPVFQDFKLFALPVTENVLCRPMSADEAGRAADRARVEYALRESGAWERVTRMKDGMDTVLTREFDDKGEVLSGGEGQKVAIARVFASDAPFVILDEPTSALDPVAEYTLFGNLMQACADRTVLFVSHRLSSAVQADRVFLFDKGRIVESGTHAGLMAQNGKYADMFRRQAESYVPESPDAGAAAPAGEGVTV